MTPLVYVAGPITGDPWGCVRRATNIYCVLHRDGIHGHLPQLSVLHEIVSPHTHDHWVTAGLTIIERCDGLVRIPGDSAGADTEVAHADGLGLPVLDWLPVGAHVADHLRWFDGYNAWCDDVRARAAQR